MDKTGDSESELLKKHEITSENRGLRKEHTSLENMHPKPLMVEGVKILESGDSSTIILEIWENPDFKPLEEEPAVRIQLDRELAMGLAYSILELDKNG
jgi:hypothetical protein